MKHPKKLTQLDYLKRINATLSRIEDALIMNQKNKPEVIASKPIVDLVDSVGHCTIATIAEQVAPNKSYYLTQPTISNVGFEDLIDKVRSTQPYLLKGIYLPLTLPKMTHSDYGTALEAALLKTEIAYKQVYPHRAFYNWRKGELANQVTIVEPRHQQLIDQLKKGSVKILYFPTVFQGFSVPAAREAVKSFPDGFALSGAYDIVHAVTTYPTTLARDCYVPGLDSSAVSWQDPEYSLCVNPDGSQLEFGYRDLGPRGLYSAALSVFGQSRE